MNKHLYFFFTSITIITIAFCCGNTSCLAQKLKLKPRSKSALTGKQFAILVNDSTLTLQRREEMIYHEVKKGNIPTFLRKFTAIHSKSSSDSLAITYFSLPDYLAIGSDNDFFYVPMTPILAQRVAKLLHCSLPSKKMVDTIYQRAQIKLIPHPIPPTRTMTTVPIFLSHSDIVRQQLLPYLSAHSSGALTAGHKKDLIISNKIYTEKMAKVVIYGWHQANGKPIQPVYNKHTNLWTDYSHGIRLISEKAIIHQGKKKTKTTVQKILGSDLHRLLSDEGAIKNPVYPITLYQ